MRKITNFGIWFTGFSGSGKTTLANNLYQRFNNHNISSYILDGDILRNGINSDLSFSEEDRKENIRRVSYLFRIVYDINVIPISACISPFQTDRDFARSLIPKSKFVEIFLSTPFEVCEHRDVKGHYKSSRENKITDFTGIASPYEVPVNPELIINTENYSIEQCGDKIISFLHEKRLINKL